MATIGRDMDDYFRFLRLVLFALHHHKSPEHSGHVDGFLRYSRWEQSQRILAPYVRALPQAIHLEVAVVQHRQERVGHDGQDMT